MHMQRILFLLTVAVLSLFAGEAYAQRDLPGQTGIQFTSGGVNHFFSWKSGGERHYFTSLAFTHTNRNRTYWLYGLDYQIKEYDYEDESVPKAQFTGEAGYFVPLAADRGRNVVLSVGFSALTGYESSNWGNKLLHDGARLRDADCFLYGGALTAEVETYLCDKVVFLVSVRERALAGSTVGTFHTQFGFGFKFIIN